MTMAPSTMMPKSSAPRLSRLALTSIGHHPAEGEQHRERDNERSNERRAQITQRTRTTPRLPGRRPQQIGGDGSNGLVHQRGAVIDGRGDHAFRQMRLISASFLRLPERRCGCFRPSAYARCPAPLPSPFCVAAPVRSSLPIRISATSLMRMGIPAASRAVILPISSRFVTCQVPEPDTVRRFFRYNPRRH